jgi:hypothetical protein
MTYRNAVSIAMVVLLIFGIAGTTSGQNGDKSPGSPMGQISNIFGQQVHALGKRVQISGKEKTIYTGQLYDKEGRSTPARVIHQLPGLIRLEGFKGQGGAISFDGEKSHGVTYAKNDESLLETFLDDFPEGMLDAVQKGSAMRLIGRGFGPDPKSLPNYSGQRYDIFEVAGPIRCLQDRPIRSKRYYFDSKTGLLLSVRYHDFSKSVLAKIETRFSEWTLLEGSAYPARIEHYKDGALVLSFMAEQIASEPMTDAADFR